MGEKVTKVPIRVSTRELLKSFGKKGETYDKIILDLIKLKKEVSM